jgi:uncharacterized membrane protein
MHEKVSDSANDSAESVLPKTSNSPGVTLERSTRKPLLITGGVILFTLVLAMLWPGSLSDKFLLITSGTCAQRSAHTYYLDGQKLPVEARMVGIFAGFLLTWLFLWFIGRGRAGKFSRTAINLVLGLMFLSMVVDGLNATFHDLGWTTLYPPQNWLRLITGTMSGIGLAGLIQPLFNYALWKHPVKIPPFKNWPELGIMLILGAGLVLAVMSGWGWLFWVLAIITVVGGLWMLTVMNLLIYFVLAQRENTLRDTFDFLTPAALVFLFSLAEFAATAALRQTLIGTAV